MLKIYYKNIKNEKLDWMDQVYNSGLLNFNTN